VRDRLTFMLWTMANQLSQSAQPSASPATDAAERALPAADQREQWQVTHRAKEREWNKHSTHRGMLLPEDYLSSASAAGRGGKSHPDTGPANADPAPSLAKRTGLGTSGA